MKSALTAQEAIVLWAAQHRAESSASEIARVAGLGERAVRYNLDRLIARRILRPMVLVDVTSLGYLNYDLYLAVAIKESRRQGRFVEWL